MLYLITQLDLFKREYVTCGISGEITAQLKFSQCASRHIAEKNSRYNI
jgi:hypothetical protein